MKPAKKSTDHEDVHESNDIFLAAVGASAGGLDAIYHLFNNPIPREAAFVIIQHLPPDYQSMTAELLAKHSGEVVTEVKDKMRVEAGKIYVMSERKRLTIQQGAMQLEASEASDINNPIDWFYTSLAKECGNKSIGVVLSGSNDDGTIGAKAIKEAGGFVLTQDPRTTSFDSMPRSVISSGYSDLTLAPETMMEEIKKYLKFKMANQESTERQEELIEEIISLIKDHSPLDFSEYKRPTLKRRIIRRMSSKNIETLSDYLSFLNSAPEEMDALAKEFLISVTQFFRDTEAFNTLKDEVLPDIIRKKSPDVPIKIWSVGCATGEEAYSIAILIDELLEAKKLDIEVKIFATDMDQNALSEASKGFYSNHIEQEVSSERLGRYFTKINDEYKVKDILRQMIIFAQHDITRHP
ncbi:MAG: chemotaxis protein CheB, partial [Cryomorphaceae bacterium]